METYSGQRIRCEEKRLLWFLYVYVKQSSTDILLKGRLSVGVELLLCGEEKNFLRPIQGEWGSC